MKTRELFDRYSRLKNAVAEAYSRESCDERHFAELVMQLGVVKAQIAPLHALAVRTGEDVSRRIEKSTLSGDAAQRRTSTGEMPPIPPASRLPVDSLPPSRIDAVLRGASSMLAALSNMNSPLRCKPEVGLGRRRRFHWFARGTGLATIDFPVVRLLP